MNPFEELRIGLADGYQAYARYFAAPQNRGAVLYHHGIQSHCGWYEASARFLQGAGYCVLQVDRRGSGRNAHQRGHAASAQQLIDDAVAAKDELLRRTHQRQYHVVGVSWGGKLAVAAFVSHPDQTASLSLVTPGLFPRIGVTRTQMAKIGFSMLYEPDRLFDIPLNDSALFTADRRWAEFIDTDPLTLRSCSASFYLASRRMDRMIARLGDAPPVPLHLMLAQDERIIDNEHTARFVRGLPQQLWQITWYQRARHSLEFENNPQLYYDDLARFVAQAGTNGSPVIA